MSSALSNVTAESAFLPRASSLAWQILRDLGGVTLLAIASMVAGLVMNRLSHRPLPIVYQTPEQYTMIGLSMAAFSAGDRRR